jgi:hypothetical protein
MKKTLAIAACLIALTAFGVTVWWYSQAPQATSLNDNDIFLIERPSPHTNMFSTLATLKTYVGAGSYDPLGAAQAATNGLILFSNIYNGAFVGNGVNLTNVAGIGNNVALSPLSYGCIGDGVHDDSIGMSNCVAAANVGLVRNIDLQGRAYLINLTLKFTNPFVGLSGGMLIATNPTLRLILCTGDKDYFHDMIIAGPSNAAPGSMAISTAMKSNNDYVQAIKIERCFITNFWQGVALSNAVGTRIEGCGITACFSNSVFIVNADQTIIDGCVLGFANPFDLVDWGKGNYQSMTNCKAVWSEANLGTKIEDCDINFCAEAVHVETASISCQRDNFESLGCQSGQAVLHFTNCSANVGITVIGCNFGQQSLGWPGLAGVSNNLTSILIENSYNTSTLISGCQVAGYGDFVDFYQGASTEFAQANRWMPPNVLAVQGTKPGGNMLGQVVVYGQPSVNLPLTGSGTIPNLGSVNTWVQPQMMSTNAVDPNLPPYYITWPAAPTTPGACCFVNSNSTVYLLQSAPNGMTWTATNKIGR